MQEVNNMAWIKAEYSKNKVKKAGKAILDEEMPYIEWRKNVRIVNNWRSAHAYPLYIISSKLKQIAKGFEGSFVVTRLKRMDSIIAKLKRNPGMGLSGMQDLGGCRVVTNTLDDVYDIADAYEDSRVRHIMCREKDYIQNPKFSGYRCLHRVYKYQSDKPDSTYNNMFVEIQFRTHLQHLWATAVETMGIYTKSNLKASMGNEVYLRFFALASSLFALEEGTPVVPETSTNKDELIKEISKINEQHQIFQKLRSIQVLKHVNDFYSDRIPSIGWYLLTLYYNDLDVGVRVFAPNELKEANQAYDEAEAGDEPIDVVLVTAESFKQLKQAYPNYFMDITEFIAILEYECFEFGMHQ